MKKEVYFLGLLIFCSCAGIQKSALNERLETLERKFNHHTGLVIYDFEKKDLIYDYNGDHYFTPASNTKILTFYTSLRSLKDSLVTFAYKEKGDSLLLWPAGDPTFLNPEFPASGVLDKINDQGHHPYISYNHVNVIPFGPGWAWDDYPYLFSTERAALPIYGNYFSIIGDSLIDISIPYFKHEIYLDDSLNYSKFTREPWSNDLYYFPGKFNEKDTVKIPFQTSDWLSTILLSDTLNITLLQHKQNLSPGLNYITSLPSDTAYKKMMQESNNFVAEQLLLQSSFLTLDTLSSEAMISYARENYFSDLPQPPIWKDGSGLSRYNLITPLSLVEVLNRLLEEFEQDRIFNLMAQGGKSGTLKNYYVQAPPYIFAKTGTLSNNHNLSGYLISKKGKIFIFSFMNNNYPTSSILVKENMEKILHEFYLNN